ncbi:MAG: RNA polymerase-binding protein DksA [Burkholderiales bacterium]|nr:MAG: RNA polymerase-binding protein DksA [Burkholderiales bacterium]
MKAPATRTATSGKSAAAGARPASASRAKGAPQPASPARASRAASGSASTRSTPKTAAKAVSRASAVPAAKAPGKAAKAPASPAVAKPARPSAVKDKPEAKTPAASGKTAPAASRKVSKAVAAPAPAKPAEKAVSKAVAKARKVPETAPQTSPPPVAMDIEPAPRPPGKRAAKKAMLEQMTQAEVVPSHAPDAAKATFSTLNERSVMTTSVPSSVQKDPKRANNWKSLPVEQLTDQDILSMPEGEYMNDVQLAFFRRKLAQLKSDMLANAGETTEHLREDTVVVPDPADRATIEEEHALELRTRDRERKLLKKIEQAIARIDAGDYGYCDETGEPIGVGRLLARPTASLSLEAQQRRELKQKMFGD